MRYHYLNYDPKRYSYRLHQNQNGKLEWSSAKRQDALIVQTPFGQSAVEFMREFCDDKTNRPFSDQQQYFPVGKGVSFRFVSAVERAKNQSCSLNGKGYTYTVFSCRVRKDDDGQDVCDVYAPLIQAVNPVSCNVPRQISVTVARMARKEGFFRNPFAPVRERYQLYRVAFQARDIPPKDGDLMYQVGPFQYPILGEMYRAGSFYIRASEMPEVRSRNPGLTVIVSDKG